MRIALITGASSGLGREFVRQLGAGTDVNAIWAVARRTERLEALGRISRCPVRALALDLTQTESLRALEAALNEERPEIRWLINAAGFGRMSPVRGMARADSEAMIDLNCRAAVSVTEAALPYCTRGSRIVELCSVAAYQPLPGLALYAASKAFLQSYTKALHHELLGSGIHVTAVCPYWVKDTEFISRASAEAGDGVRHYPLASKSASVVRCALRDAAWNLWVSTPGPASFVLRVVDKVIPHCLMVPLWDGLRRL